jgi:hypothetical protein
MISKYMMSRDQAFMDRRQDERINLEKVKRGRALCFVPQCFIRRRTDGWENPAGVQTCPTSSSQLYGIAQ